MCIEHNLLNEKKRDMRPLPLRAYIVMAFILILFLGLFVGMYYVTNPKFKQSPKQQDGVFLSNQDLLKAAERERDYWIHLAGERLRLLEECRKGKPESRHESPDRPCDCSRAVGSSNARVIHP